MTVLDDYLVDPKLSLVDKTRIQAQVLVPVLQALRSELGKRRLTLSSSGPCATGRSTCLPPLATALMVVRVANGRIHTAMAEITEQDVKLEMLPT